MSRTYVVLNDIQYPFHDEQCMELVVDTVIKDIKPNGVILNGDVADCYPISSFTKNPMQRADLLLERKLCTNLLTKLSKYAGTIDWLEGNHEKRLWRMVADKVPQLGIFEELSFPKLFKLADYGVRWYEYGALVNLGHLRLTHGEIIRKDSAATAKAYFNKYRCSVMIGHTQRFGAYYITCLGVQYVCFENGCLCSMKPEYTPNPNWQQGFSVVHVDDNKMFNVQQIPIFKIGGKAYCMYGKERYWAK